MPLAFDLISDLHVETWPTDLDWNGQPTSPTCVIVGDVATSRSHLLKTLTHLSSCYQAVFYIDGNEEHRDYYDNLPASYENLVRELKSIPNLVYLQDNVVVIDGVAILGTNGWWGFDFDPAMDVGRSVKKWQDKTGYGLEVSQTISSLCETDANYLCRSVKRLQKHYDVRHIVIATHTVPCLQLISHDIDLEYDPKLNCMGNRYLEKALDQDTENKIHTWCFGHYHNPIDQIYRGVRFVNNCRGKGKTDYSQSVFYPKRIVINN